MRAVEISDKLADALASIHINDIKQGYSASEKQLAATILPQLLFAIQTAIESEMRPEHFFKIFNDYLGPLRRAAKQARDIEDLLTHAPTSASMTNQAIHALIKPTAEAARSAGVTPERFVMVWGDFIEHLREK